MLTFSGNANAYHATIRVGVMGDDGSMVWGTDSDASLDADYLDNGTYTASVGQASVGQCEPHLARERGKAYLEACDLALDMLASCDKGTMGAFAYVAKRLGCELREYVRDGKLEGYAII